MIVFVFYGTRDFSKYVLHDFLNFQKNIVSILSKKIFKYKKSR